MSAKEEQPKKNTMIFKMSGKLDNQTATQLRERIMEALVPGCRMLLDMCKVDAISSAAQRIMLLLTRQLQPLGCKLILVGLTEPIYTAMEATGFSKYFEIVPAIPGN